jgi:ABC transporter family protein
MHICGTMRDGDEAPAASSWSHGRSNVSSSATRVGAVRVNCACTDLGREAQRWTSLPRQSASSSEAQKASCAKRVRREINEYKSSGCRGESAATFTRCCSPPEMLRVADSIGELGHGLCADFSVVALAERVHPGEVVAIVGESGSGKTTLLKGRDQNLGVTHRSKKGSAGPSIFSMCIRRSRSSSGRRCMCT